jgi:hypothetical protein
MVIIAYCEICCPGLCAPDKSNYYLYNIYFKPYLWYIAYKILVVQKKGRLSKLTMIKRVSEGFY